MKIEILCVRYNGLYLRARYGKYLIPGRAELGHSQH